MFKNGEVWNLNSEYMATVIKQDMRITVDKMISQNRFIATILSGFPAYCPLCPEQRVVGKIDKVRLNFSRYTMRTMYYAESFFRKYRLLIDALEGDGITSENATLCDELYFDFDAFIFSLKSILDGNILNNRQIHPSLIDYWKQMRDGIETFFADPLLDPLRNDIVHLNKFGTSISPAVIKFNRKYIFQTALNIEGCDDLDGLFKRLMKSSLVMIKNISIFLMMHYCETYGYPKKDVRFSYYNFEGSLSDFVKIDEQN